MRVAPRKKLVQKIPVYGSIEVVNADRSGPRLGSLSPDEYRRAARRDDSLADFGALYEVMKTRKHVKGFFYGHTHRWERPFCDSIHLINLPTTAWVFDHRQPRGWIDARLSPDGATLVFNPLNKKEPVETETIQFRWRT